MSLKKVFKSVNKSKLLFLSKMCLKGYLKYKVNGQVFYDCFKAFKLYKSLRHSQISTYFQAYNVITHANDLIQNNKYIKHIPQGWEDIRDDHILIENMPSE